MANFLPSEPRRLYSWWWDSHISPKNSKWLQENLTDMDSNVKAMIKLIEEDADSFARRAEMYYKKRPELMNLVEEFYRTFRALAERYDQATGALRYAHRTMAEAFPNQNSLVLSDESPCSSSGTDLEPRTPEMPAPSRALLDPDNLQKDALGMSSHVQLIKLNGANSEGSDALTSRKGLKQLNEMFAEGEAHSHFHEERARKGLQFQEEEGKHFHYETHEFPRNLQIQVPSVNEDIRNELECLKNQLSQLLTENQNLKCKIASESERGDKAETEAQHLKNYLSKWNIEKETAIHQYQQSLERISSLDIQISHAEDELKKLDDDMVMRAMNLTNAEERCLLLEKTNQSLQLELDNAEQKTKTQQEELNQKLEELDKINIWIKGEQQRCMDAELALLSLRKLHSQSQEELKLLALEVQRGHDKLKDLEPRNVSLEEEVHNLTEENSYLSDKNDSLFLKIKDLVDQISISMEIREKLDNERRLRIEENKVLQYELNSLKEDKKDLEWRHKSLTEDMEAVILSTESLQVLVKDMHDEAVELKEICKKHEDEKVLLLENLKNMEKILENLVLENSLMDSNVELEGLSEKIKTFEGSSESLHGEVATHTTENSVLVSHIETVSRTMEKTVHKNAFLEGCLSDMNVELEGLRVSLKDLEEYCQTLHDQKVNLLDENDSLVSQVETISKSLESLETRHAELENKRLSLEREKNLTLHHLKELEGCLKLEKEQHGTLILSRNCQIATLENQVEMEQQKVMTAALEIFVLQGCLSDMMEMNLNLSKDCQKHLEASRSAENLVSQLKEEVLIQKKKMMTLSKHNEKLVHGIRLLLGTLNIIEYESLGRVEDESLLQIIFAEVKMLQNHISDMQDEILHFNLEISVIVTHLRQLGSDVKDLRMENFLLEEELLIVKEQLPVLQLKKKELLEMNEDVEQDLQVKGQREEELMVEVKTLHRELSSSQETHQALQAEFNKLLDENLLLSQKFYNLKKEKDTFEEEKSTVPSEAMILEHLYKCSNAEKALESELHIDDINFLHATINNFDRDIKTMNGKINLLEAENTHLKESVACLMECRNHLVISEFDLNTAKYICEELNSQAESGKILLVQREMELSETNQKIQVMQDRNRDLNTNLEALNQEIIGAKMVREELEKKFFNLLEDIACTNEEIVHISKDNEMLHGELRKMNSHLEVLSSREEHVTCKQPKRTDENRYCKAETTMLLDDIKISSASAAIFEEKVTELTLECESLEICAMLQRDVLTEKITSTNESIKELEGKLNDLEGENRELKAKMNEYLSYVMSLWNSLLSLEGETCSLAGLHSSHAQEKQNSFLLSNQQHDKSNRLSEDPTVMVPAGVLEFEKLIVKVEAVKQMITYISSRLKHEGFDYGIALEAVRNDIEGINVGGSAQEEDKMKMDIIVNEEGEEHGADYKKQKYNGKICNMSYEHMKDIQLDQAFSPLSYGNIVGSHGLTRTDSSETDDQVLKLWEAGETNCSQIQKLPLIALEHGIVAVEEEKSEYPSSEQVAEKELSVDRFEAPTLVKESYQEQCKEVIERLALDAQRLAALQVTIHEVKRKMEGSEKSKHTKSLEHKTVKAKIKEIEGALLQLIEINGKLTRDLEDYHAYSDGTTGVQGAGKMGMKKISERARRISEKVGMLELELQKIQYILLKVEEEHENNKARAVDRRLKVLLKGYLYGRRNVVRHKKGNLCGCLRPKKW